MEANPIKCEAMYSMPTKRPLTLPDLQLNGTPLPVVQECKILGVHLNSELNWNTHIKNIIKKANKCIFILIKAKKFRFSLATLVTLYSWYVRTALEYAAPVWHPGLTEQQHAQLERVQKRCVRIIVGRDYTTYEQALQRLQLTTLRDRRDLLTLRLARSMLRSADHRDLLPPAMNQVHRYNTRGNHRLQHVPCTRARHANSFVPYAVRLLNANM